MIKASDLSPFKLNLISLGSLTGMGLGLLLSFLFTSTLWRVSLLTVFLFIGISSIFKNLKYLTRE
jgi:hypothetical protein